MHYIQATLLTLATLTGTSYSHTARLPTRQAACSTPPNDFRITANVTSTSTNYGQLGYCDSTNGCVVTFTSSAAQATTFYSIQSDGNLVITANGGSPSHVGYIGFVALSKSSEQYVSFGSKAIIKKQGKTAQPKCALLAASDGSCTVHCTAKGVADVGNRALTVDNFYGWELGNRDLANSEAIVVKAVF